MAESFQKLDNILRGWAKDKVQKSLVEAVNRYDKQIEGKQTVTFPALLKNCSEKILEHSLRRQSNETKRNTKLVLKLVQGKKALFCLDFNKPNKQNVYEINVIKKCNFSQSQNNSLLRLVSGKKHHIKHQT